MSAKQPKTAKCPICSKLADAKHRPFCSQRCRQVDLAKWLNGSYSVPAEEEDFNEADVEALERSFNLR